MPDVRLIDANALKSKLYSLLKIEESPPMFIEGLETALAVADVAATIDAVPVVHGRWVRDEADENWFACSVCKGENGPWHKFAECTYKFCPWCGAKMDAKEEE